MPADLREEYAPDYIVAFDDHTGKALRLHEDFQRNPESIDTYLPEASFSSDHKYNYNGNVFKFHPI